MFPLLQMPYAKSVIRSFQTLLLASFILLGSGCAIMSNKFTLKTELPANYTVSVTAQYSELFAGVCFLPDDYKGDPEPDKKRFSSAFHATPFTSEFEVPVGYTLEDCFMALSGIEFMIEGTDKANDNYFDISTVELDVETYLKEDEELSTRIDEQLLQVRCHWEALKPGSPAKRELQCHGLDANGKEREGRRLGMLKNRQLQGLTLRLKVEEDETSRKP
ncbi:hypothetical protein ACOI9X_20255 [Pseudomonas sp. P2757]|uniref:hypothetical protein n=1 Tax=unclassified Pseudomonas TaxID=196821 RepID=UPI003B58F231